MKPLLYLLAILIHFLASTSVQGAEPSPKQDVTPEEWTALCYQLTKTAAIKACDQAIQLSPKQEKLYLSKGDALFSLEQYSQAEEVYHQVLQINQKSASAWQRKGWAAAAQTKYEDALNSFEQALLIEPKDQSIWFDKGLVLFLQNKEAEAEKAYQKFLVGKPLDLILLTKVANNTLEQFKSEEAYVSTTEFIIVDNLNKDKKIVLKTDNNINSARLFYSEIKVLQKSKILSNLKIIGDGEKVWLYRPDVKQYTSFGYDEFIAGDKLIFTGLYNFFYLSTPELKQAKFVTLKTLLEVTNIESFKQSLDIIAGKKHTIYEYQSNPEQPSFKLWVSPDKALIVKVQFGLQSPEIQAQITEKISQLPKQSQAFKFVPPKRAKLVKELPNLYPDNFNPFR